jgi:hypothetical protein
LITGTNLFHLDFFLIKVDRNVSAKIENEGGGGEKEQEVEEEFGAFDYENKNDNFSQSLIENCGEGEYIIRGRSRSNSVLDETTLETTYTDRYTISHYCL